MESHVSKLESLITTMESHVSKLESLITTMESHVSKLESRIAVLESYITNKTRPMPPQKYYDIYGKMPPGNEKETTLT